MELFKKQIAFVDNFEKLIFLELEKTIQSYDYVLKDFIVEKQLFEKGVDGNNTKLPGYSRFTIRKKKAVGQPTDRTTTRDSGEFHASIEINSFSDRFEVTSNVTYDKFIIKRYKRDILKLTDDNFRKFLLVYFLPNLKNNVKNKFTK